MTDDREDRPPSLPVANYSPAIARAVAWLGDRYLLAQPINAARRNPSPATGGTSSPQAQSTSRRVTQ